MTKKKKTCYVCKQDRYLRGFTGIGKRRNNVCNLCLFKSSRKPIFMEDFELDQKNQPKNHKKLTAEELNAVIEQSFDE